MTKSFDELPSLSAIATSPRGRSARRWRALVAWAIVAGVSLLGAAAGVLAGGRDAPAACSLPAGRALPVSCSDVHAGSPRPAAIPAGALGPAALRAPRSAGPPAR